MIQNKTILLTIDVEDWFQVENFKTVIPYSSWEDFDLRVEKNTKRILNLFDSSKGGNISATFFILGWVAKRKPALVREIDSRGHEVASHGFNHHLYATLSENELIKDLQDSKKLLEDITGNPVSGYRSPSFSMDNALIPTLKKCGYSYDSSYNSFNLNARYGRINLQEKQRSGLAFMFADNFYEIPVSNLKFGKTVIPLGGGGYFRMMPPVFFQKGVERVIKKDKGFVFYAHPWEFDPEQPRVTAISLDKKIRHYINLKKTTRRLENLIQKFRNCSFLTCTEYLNRIKS